MAMEIYLAIYLVSTSTGIICICIFIGFNLTFYIIIIINVYVDDRNNSSLNAKNKKLKPLDVEIHIQISLLNTFNTQQSHTKYTIITASSLRNRVRERERTSGIQRNKNFTSALFICAFDCVHFRVCATINNTRSVY